MAGCGGSSQPPPRSIEVIEAYSPAVAERGGRGYAYIRLVNRSHELERLIAVRSDIAAEVQMVQASRELGGRSVPLPAGFQIAAGATLDLGPGRSHLVLGSLARPLVSGETYSLQLQFKNSGTVDVEVAVRP